MLLFRSERHVERWCATRQMARGGVLSLEQGWELARRWYGDRLSASWRRRTASEAHAVFADLGLTGPFWQLEP